jgi:hypothetical protein
MTWQTAQSHDDNFEVAHTSALVKAREHDSMVRIYKRNGKFNAALDAGLDARAIRTEWEV